MNIMVAMQHYGAYVKEAVRQKVDFIVSGAGLPWIFRNWQPDRRLKKSRLCLP